MGSGPVRSINFPVYTTNEPQATGLKKQWSSMASRASVC